MALPNVNINYEYDSLGSNILQHAMSSTDLWYRPTDGPQWRFIPGIDYSLDIQRMDMAILLINQGANLLATRNNVIGKQNAPFFKNLLTC